MEYNIFILENNMSIVISTSLNDVYYSSNGQLLSKGTG